MFKHLTVDFKYETQKQSLKYSKAIRIINKTMLKISVTDSFVNPAKS